MPACWGKNRAKASLITNSNKQRMMEKPEIKCIVWDLDGTLWDGILLESDDVMLKSGIKEIIRILDSRGILHSKRPAVACLRDHLHTCHGPSFQKRQHLVQIERLFIFQLVEMLVFADSG